MRINRETLLKIGRDTVSSRARQSHRLVAAYLCGALLGEDYLLGGTADIDLVLIHTDFPPDIPTSHREIIPLSAGIHLDITHHLQAEYLHPRQLRLHPWLGPTIKSCLILHDPQHFMDFAQASVRGQFDIPSNILARARPQAEHARQMWTGLLATPASSDPLDIAVYMKAVSHAANAVALLNGAPLTERRFLLDFQTRSTAVSHPGLPRGVLGLLGALHLEPASVTAWLPSWQSAYQSISSSQIPARLHPYRMDYYRTAFEAILESENPEAVFWPLLSTWTSAASLLPEDSPALSGWREACVSLGLLGEAFQDRLSALDAFLDLVDETLETWAVQSGAL